MLDPVFCRKGDRISSTRIRMMLSAGKNEFVRDIIGWDDYYVPTEYDTARRAKAPLPRAPVISGFLLTGQKPADGFIGMEHRLFVIMRAVIDPDQDRFFMARVGPCG